MNTLQIMMFKNSNLMQINIKQEARLHFRELAIHWQVQTD